MKVKYLRHPEVGFIKIFGKRSLVVNTNSIYSYETDMYFGNEITQGEFEDNFYKVLNKTRELLELSNDPRAIYTYSPLTDNYYSFSNQTICLVRNNRIGYFCSTCEVIVRNKNGIRTTRSAMLRSLKICSSLIQLTFKINPSVLL